MAIDIGAGAADYDTFLNATFTGVDLTNSANASGTIDTFECWYRTNSTGVVIGTFYGSGTAYTSRDSENIGNVTAGSKQTFTGLDCTVTLGDFIGVYAATGTLEANSTAGSDIYYKAGNQFGQGQQTYTLLANYKLALYGTGTEAGGYSWTVEALREAEVLYCEALTDTTIDTRRDITTENEASRTQIVADMKVAFPSSTKYYKHHHHHNGRALCVLEEV